MQRIAKRPRSRFGCTQCRDRHRKCDEKRPSCGFCEERELKCSYETVLKWSNPGSISTFGVQQRKKEKPPKSSNGAKQSPSSAPRSEDEGAGCQATSYDPVHEARSLLPDISEKSSDFIPQEAHKFAATNRIAVSSESGLLSSTNDSRSVGSSVTAQVPYYPSCGEGSNVPRHDHIGGLVPQLSNSLDEIASPSSLNSYTIDNILNSLLHQFLDNHDEEIAFIYFVEHVCSVIPAYDGPQNPYRKLAIVALAHPVLLHGILAVSTAYMYNHGRSHEHILSERQSRALKSLHWALNAFQTEKATLTPDADSSSDIIQDSSVLSRLSAKEVVLAAVTMQTCSVLMSGIGVFEDHVKCALHFIQDLGWFYTPPKKIFMWLLVYRFATVDVFLAILRLRNPIAPLDFFMYRPNEYLDKADPSFREMMGFSQRVLCFLAQISVLSIDLTERNMPIDLVQAKALMLETEMRTWGHHYHKKMIQSLERDPNPVGTLPTPKESMNSQAGLEIVCEVHYWIAQLLLMRRVFFDSTKSLRVQNVRKYLFRLMDQLPAGCGPDSCMTFPLYLAAREAVTPEDREWVRRKHAATMDVYRHQARVAFMDAVEEIWAQSDDLDWQDTGNVPQWKTPKECFIRERDKNASYFAF
ncbi:hypothetical protein, variant [Verruconis gallopava]|uniref:Zn(2)-C6 fungal-type domain-containing protein n=1 Tax=Verruconis gallopava TaxID=253628 RepID=A0A0D1YJK3_9PEZI|nr:uncharacterized protein PV09_07538 [Verruconis gallopava]XP_016210891.1 hypothetical protein, variant [Verruconis gallopava]KIW01021.1 hypothetical protein PV09_07538 [Verruconis gallopava]KIW01022.1 hypothetical protein, variant [Verruconis gallopava]